MIKLFDQMTFPLKKKLIFMFLSCFILFLMGYTSMSYGMHEDTFFYITLLSMMLPFMITWIMMDMIHPSDVMLEAYLGSQKVFRYKFFTGCWYCLLLPFMFLSCYLLCQLVLYSFYPTLIHFKLYVHFVLDLIMISYLSLILSKVKHPSLCFIIPILSAILVFLASYEPSFILYIIIPITQPMILSYRLAILYKVCYISLGFILNHLKVLFM